MLKGRLGLETARFPHADRHGLLWLERGELCVIDGCLHFMRGSNSLTPQIDQIPHQSVSMILLGPGSSVTHDALRLLARHGTLMAAVGVDGVRSYTAPPLMPDRSDVARRQAELWGNPRRRISVARHMYALRLGEILPHRELDTLRGIEGSRGKTMYRLMADKHEIEWNGRHYDRADPMAADIPNQALNHAATAVQAAAAIAVQSLAALHRWVSFMKTQGNLLCSILPICFVKLSRCKLPLPLPGRSPKVRRIRLTDWYAARRPKSFASSRLSRQ